MTTFITPEFCRRIDGAVIRRGKDVDGSPRVAVFNKAETHRFALEIGTPRGVPLRPLLWIGLNPSTADEMNDDPTIRRVRGFSRSTPATGGIEFDGVLIANLFPLRSTDPRGLKSDDLDRWHDLNLLFIEQMAAESFRIIVGWGRHGAPGRVARDYARDVLGVLRRVAPLRIYCLGRNSDGTPKHPLYLRADTEAVPFE